MYIELQKMLARQNQRPYTHGEAVEHELVS